MITFLNFFYNTSDESYSNNDDVDIITVNTNISIIKIEKTIYEDKYLFRFIVNITDENGDNFNINSIITSKSKFQQLIQNTIEILESNSQLNKYAEDLNY